MSREPSKSRIRTCVLGAGAAGLCAVRNLSRRQIKPLFECDLYEKGSNIGGTWNYTDLVGLDQNGLPVHTSMYKNLRTNLPTQLMEFQDLEFKSERSFVKHNDVLKYLEDYAKHFNLLKYIKISRAENVWKVLIRDLIEKQNFEKIYDSIFVCNGRYSKPNIPQDVKGIDKFKGTVIHSHDYRIPDPFTGLNVLVLGGGPSGSDISIEVSEVAKQVVLCHKHLEPFINIPKNIVQELSEIKEITETEVEFTNRNKYSINAIIFATGYQFDFSFMDSSCGINVNKNQRVEGIYLHLINERHPSMAIFGIPLKVVPFPLFQTQVLFFIKCMTGDIRLPSEEQMKRQTQEDLDLRKSMGLSERHSHKMVANLLFDYWTKLAEMGDIESFTPVFKQLYNDLEVIRKQNSTQYKRLNFKIISKEKYIICNKYLQ